MSKQKWTKEPWEVSNPPRNVRHDQQEDRFIYTEINERKLHIAETFQFHNGEFNAADGSSIANADRIIACVNALAGINPEAVGEIMRIFKDIHHILRLDRGDYKGAGSQEMFTIDALYDHFDNMEAAIALAESEE